MSLKDLNKGISRKPIIVNEDNVKFSFYAPRAKRVQVTGISGSMKREKTDLEPEGNGYFSVEIEDLTAGFYYYNILVNGTETVNLQAPVAFVGGKAVNYLEVPEKEFNTCMLRDIPHGSIHRHIMYSKLDNAYKTCYTYTPPKYTNSDKAYPVIYLRHNKNEDETSWIHQGKVNYIMDNMIYEGKCKEVIIVIIPQNILRPDEAGYNASESLDEEIIKETKSFINEKYQVINNSDNKNIFGMEAEDNRGYTDWTAERKRFAEFVAVQFS